MPATCLCSIAGYCTPQNYTRVHTWLCMLGVHVSAVANAYSLLWIHAFPMLSGPAGGLTQLSLQIAAYVNEECNHKHAADYCDRDTATNTWNKRKQGWQALSWNQLLSITLTKHANKKCYKHFEFACECYNSCLQVYHWRQQLWPAAGFDTQARLKNLRVGSMTTKVVTPTGNLTCR